MTKALLIFQ